MDRKLPRRDCAKFSSGDAPAQYNSSAFVGFDPSARAELVLCNVLEEAANELPTFCLGRFIKLAAALRSMSGRLEARRIEERLSRVSVESDAGRILLAALSMINLEECEDADIAVELAEALDSAAEDGEVANPNALGYLMRSFFENRRRHLAWRREAFVEPARRAMDADSFAFVIAPLSEGRPELRIIATLSS